MGCGGIVLLAHAGRQQNMNAAASRQGCQGASLGILEGPAVYGVMAQAQGR